MLSQLVTAAKGILFAEQNLNSDFNTATTEPEEAPTAMNPKMVTRRSSVQVVIPSVGAGVNGSSSETNGKRKPEVPESASPGSQGNKRRKRSSIQKLEPEVKKDTKEAAPGKHFRFDSEEPAVPETAEAEEPVDAQQDDEEESSDDEAPETVDNSAQLSRIKLEAKKREKARQIEQQVKREKRRQLDEARKQQAKASGKRKETHAYPAVPGGGTYVDDLVSESSETLQGSYTQDARRPTLPALLPDDILNAVPETRPPTPLKTKFFSQKKPTKLRFLEKKEKAPKDVRMGDVAIRVLEGGSSQRQPNTAPPPKASKAGRNAKSIWLKQARSTGHVNGMRMVSSGSKGFVRK